MSQTFLVYDNLKISQLYSLNLNVQLSTDVILKHDEKSAMELLRAHPTIDLIITKSHIETFPMAMTIFNYLQESGRNIPMIVIGSEPQLPTQVVKLEAGIDRKYLISEAAKILGITPKEVSKKQNSEYIAIPISHLEFTEKAVCDLFVRVKKGVSDFQYIKRFHRGEVLIREELKKLESSSNTNLYIISDQRVSFINNYSEKLITLINDSKLPISERVSVTSAAARTVSAQILDIGITPETVEFANATMKSMIKISQDVPSISKLFLLMLANKEGYYFKHCQILTYVLGHMIKHLDWGIADQIEKLCFVAFFHDLSLISNEPYARVRSEEDMIKLRLTTEQKNQIKNHALHILTIIQKYPHTPMGADMIIRQHHGTQNGFGFPTAYTINIFPMAILFVVAQDFVDRIVDIDIEKFNLPNAIKNMYEKFPLSKYKQVTQTLEQLVI